MTKIKVCGLSRMADIEIVNKYKPDYVGFVFAKSKRQVSKERAKELIRKLNGDIKTVGVFVNSEIEVIKDTAEVAGLDVIQLHGDESEEYTEKLRECTDCEIWQAVRVLNSGDIKKIISCRADKILLDKYKGDSYGGSGEKFEWESFGKSDMPKNIILAGGLDGNNVIDGIKVFMPYAVDVSSGVETDGIKDENKIREFIEIVRKGETV